MGDEERTYVTKHVEAAVAWLKSRGLDCVVLGVNQDGKYCMKSNVGKSYTWILMDMAMAKLRQEIEQDGQSSGDNQRQGKE